MYPATGLAAVCFGSWMKTQRIFIWNKLNQNDSRAVDGVKRISGRYSHLEQRDRTTGERVSVQLRFTTHWVLLCPFICLHLYSSVFICLHLYSSLFISIHLHSSLFISIHLYLSLFISIHLYLSLFILIYLYFPLSSRYIHLYLSSSLFIFNLYLMCCQNFGGVTDVIRLHQRFGLNDTVLKALQFSSKE